MRPPPLLFDADVIKLDVQELVDRFQGAGDAEVVFQLNGDGVGDEGFKETVGRGRGLAPGCLAGEGG